MIMISMAKYGSPGGLANCVSFLGLEWLVYNNRYLFSPILEDEV